MHVMMLFCEMVVIQKQPRASTFSLLRARHPANNGLRGDLRERLSRRTAEFVMSVRYVVTSEFVLVQYVNTILVFHFLLVPQWFARNCDCCFVTLNTTYLGCLGSRHGIGSSVSRSGRL